jgi:general secretion pathway protein N
MTTLVGPLRLDGNGTWTPAQGLRFTGSAVAEGAQQAQLAPLLGLVGRREGDRTIIRIGA